MAKPKCGLGVSRRMVDGGDQDGAEAARRSFRDVCGQPEMGDQFKAMFGETTSGPMPSRILELADRLDEALQRGELFDRTRRRPQAS